MDIKFTNVILKHPKQDFTVEMIIDHTVRLNEYGVRPQFANEGSRIRFDLANAVVRSEQDNRQNTYVS
ncbi:hypothetical protein [Spirosoma areae]